MSLLRRKHPTLLVLEDGSVYRGSAFAGKGEALGEVVFNTGMTGYQEILTDPSYTEQIVTMTYPLIGNYGINEEDMESAGIHIEALIVKEYQAFPSNWRSSKSLKDFLQEYDKIGVEGIDTRALTRRIRIAGAMRGIISTETDDCAILYEKIKEYPGLVGRDLVRSVSCSKPYSWKNNIPCLLTQQEDSLVASEQLRIAVLDCGVKYNILRQLEKIGCDVVVLPAETSAETFFSYRPDGVLLSNGPGDPAALPYIVETVRQLLGRIPLFGICLGHQILGQALGGQTAKLKFGHHGVNQPVKNRKTGRVEITSQNHGFVVLPESLPKDQEKTYDNLNDNTSEGLRSSALRAFSVQYDPEAAPGPHDTNYLFDEFIKIIKQEKGELR
jgi:carbamoyl-phosphate synthase small subunit